MRDGKFEWDDRKAAANLRKHDVAFELARRVFDDPRAVVWPDLDEIDEERFLQTGLVGGVAADGCFHGTQYTNAHHIGPKGDTK